MVAFTAGRPIVLEGAAAGLDPDAAGLKQRLAQAQFAGDTYAINVHVAALQRAIREACPA